MRPIKTLAATVLAASFITIPAFAQPAGRSAKAGHYAKKSPAERAKLRRARREAALKKAGVSGARLQQALATMARFDAERKPVRVEMRKAMKELRELRRNKSQNKAARERARSAMKAARKKLRTIRKNERAALGRILTKTEQAKLQAMRKARWAGHHRRHHRGDRR